MPRTRYIALVSGVLVLFAGILVAHAAGNDWPAVPSEKTREELQQRAVEFALENGAEPFPSSAEVVLSTRQEATEAVGAGLVTTDEVVYLVALEGSFTGYGARTPDGEIPKGSELWFLYDPAGQQSLDWGLNSQATDLSRLGEVSSIGLSDAATATPAGPAT